MSKFSHVADRMKNLFFCVKGMTNLMTSVCMLQSLLHPVSEPCRRPKPGIDTYNSITVFSDHKRTSSSRSAEEALL